MRGSRGGWTVLAVLTMASLAGSQTVHAQSATAGVVEVSAEDYAFNIPETLPSGWVTLRFANQGEEHHFMLLMRLPEGKTFDDYVLEVTEPFNEVWLPLRDGEIDQETALERLVEALPAWFWEVQHVGGAGLVAPDGATEVTINLEPGNYVVECYMKTADGEFHALEGMLDPLTVTAEPSGGSPPASDIRLTVTNDGLLVEDQVTPGRRTVAVHFAEHAEEGPRHNLNLARLDDATELSEVVHWINWLNVEGLEPPAPAQFLGGVREMPEGYTGYFTVDIVPGRYLWISETTAGLGILKEFSVRD